MKQLKLLKNEPKAYGGDLLKTRKGRSHGRPLDTKNTMHLVLRSSKANGEWSFKRPQNEAKIKGIVKKFSERFGVRVLSLANVGNHLHFQIKLTNRYTYRPFIRALTAAVAMAVTGASRWQKVEGKFWDCRPYTRAVTGRRGFLSLRDYVDINKIEGFGERRESARMILVQVNQEGRKEAG